MKKKPTGPAIIVLVVVGLIAYLALGYLLRDLAAARQGSGAEEARSPRRRRQIDQYRTLSAQAKAAAPIRVAELFRLEKAMPNEVDMAGIVLELSRVASDTGITFESITPQGIVAAAGYQVLPVSLVFDGNYFELSDFLYRLRSLVRVHTGRLSSSGRLFVVDSIGFAESEKSFPRIQASLIVNAYVYGDAPVPGAPTEAPAAAAAGTRPPATPPTGPRLRRPPRHDDAGPCDPGDTAGRRGAGPGRG